MWYLVGVYVIDFLLGRGAARHALRVFNVCNRAEGENVDLLGDCQH
jgi:hypothetical protein